MNESYDRRATTSATPSIAAAAVNPLRSCDFASRNEVPTPTPMEPARAR